MTNPDFSPQFPSVQRVEHIRRSLRQARWTREDFVAFCLSGCDKRQCLHICACLYDDYLDDLRDGLTDNPRRIRLSELHDAVYSAHLDEVSDFKKEYFASMAVLRSGGTLPQLNPAQRQVVEQHAQPLLPLDHPSRMALARWLGEELASLMALKLSTCLHTDDVAREAVSLYQEHPEALSLDELAKKQYYSILLANAPESARTGSTNYHRCLDNICALRGLKRTKRKGGRYSKKQPSAPHQPPVRRKGLE